MQQAEYLAPLFVTKTARPPLFQVAFGLEYSKQSDSKGGETATNDETTPKVTLLDASVIICTWRERNCGTIFAFLAVRRTPYAKSAKRGEVWGPRIPQHIHF